METLIHSASKIVLEKYGERDFAFSEELRGDRPRVTFFPYTKFAGSRWLRSVYLRQRDVKPTCCVSSGSQAELKPAAPNQETYESKTVRVKFLLHKECLFGEHFYIVGDDPMFGLWEPKIAVPLNWSDGHVWSVELDIPVGKSIQFKFILKGNTGEILWQPGPDRIFQTRENQYTLVVSEDWENAEDQTITEENPSANQIDKPIIDSGMLVPGNLAQPIEKDVSDVNNKSDGSEIPEKSKAYIAKNIGEKEMSQLKEESPANENMNMGENILGNNSRAAEVENNIEGDLINHEGDAVLVPGLPPIKTLSTEAEAQDGIASARTSEAEIHHLPELDAKKFLESKAEIDEKQETESDTHQKNTNGTSIDGEEQEVKDEAKETHHFLAKDEEQADSKPLADVFQNDLQWGQRTLKMLLSNLGLLQHWHN